MTLMENQDGLLGEIEEFLSKTGMRPAYFGKQACGNSELVKRLRTPRPKRGGPSSVNPETAKRIRTFIAEREGAMQ